MSLLTISNYAKSIERSLKMIVSDASDGVEAGLWNGDKWLKVENMTEAFEEEMDQSGPAFASAKIEGGPIAIGTFKEGNISRYTPVTYAIQLIITDEAMKDRRANAIDLGRMCKIAMYRTKELLAVQLLARALDTNYVGLDGQCLCSASHTIPGGGTYSNVLSTAYSPSVEALVIAASNLLDIPGYDGVIDTGFLPKKIVCPNAQTYTWDYVLNSKFEPVPGNFAKINVAQKWGLDVIPLPLWQNTTTDWAIITSAENGMKYKIREKENARTWRGEDNSNTHFACVARYATGWTNPRGIYYVGDGT